MNFFFKIKPRDRINVTSTYTALMFLQNLHEYLDQSFGILKIYRYFTFK